MEEQREKALRITRANKKSPAKKARVKTKVASKTEPVMGPSLFVKTKGGRKGINQGRKNCRA